MTCPHCGATARSTEKFCPKCSRLIDSPLLRIKQELDASRAALIGERKGTAATAPRPAAEAAARGGSAAPVGTPPKAAPVTPARTAPTTPPSLPAAKPPSRRERKQARRLNLESPAEHRPHGDLAGAGPLPGQSAGGTGAAEPPAPRRSVTSAVAVLVLFDLVALALLLFGVWHLEAMPAGTLGHNLAEPARVIAYVTGGLVALAALGLFAVQPFGRALQRLVALLWLPVVPFGTLLGFVMWIYLGRPGVRLLFSGRDGRQLSDAERKRLASSRTYAPAMAVVLVVLHGFATLSVVGAVANAEPYLLQVRTVSDAINTLGGVAGGTEPTAMGTVVEELERFAAAQAEYASLNGGLFDRTECLIATNSCIPGDPPRSGALDARFLQIERGGHEFLLRLGPPPEARPEGVSPTSVTAFAYLARPLTPDAGQIAYCIDETRVVCVFGPDDPLPVELGRCTEACVPLRR